MTMTLTRFLEDQMDQSVLPKGGRIIESSARLNSKTFFTCECLSQMNSNSPNTTLELT